MLTYIYIHTHTYIYTHMCRRTRAPIPRGGGLGACPPPGKLKCRTPQGGF